jgi:hypothetical protein
MGARNAANDRLCPSDAFEPVRKSIGVDSLDISSSATGGPPVKVTRAINDRISVGVTTGARPQDNGVSVNIDDTRHLRLRRRRKRGVERRHGCRMGVQIVRDSTRPNASRLAWSVRTTAVAHSRRSADRFDQASFGVQLRLAFRRAFARTMSLRMTAVRATFAGFPAFMSSLYFGLHIRIEPVATSAGM